MSGFSGIRLGVTRAVINDSRDYNLKELAGVEMVVCGVQRIVTTNADGEIVQRDSVLVSRSVGARSGYWVGLEQLAIHDFLGTKNRV